MTLDANNEDTVKEGEMVRIQNSKSEDVWGSEWGLSISFSPPGPYQFYGVCKHVLTTADAQQKLHHEGGSFQKRIKLSVTRYRQDPLRMIRQRDGFLGFRISTGKQVVPPDVAIR